MPALARLGVPPAATGARTRRPAGVAPARISPVVASGLQRLLRAAVRPTQLGVLAGGAAAAGAAVAMAGAVGSVLPAVAIGALTACAWVAATAWDGLYGAAPTEPGAPRIADAGLRGRLATVEEEAAAVRALLEGLDAQQPWFAEVEAAARGLLDHARRLAQRGDELAALRQDAAVDEVLREREELRAKVRTARDKAIAGQWREALGRKEAQLRHIASLAATAERIDAELATVESALGELRARILRMDATGRVDGIDVGATTTATLRALDQEIDSVERAAAATIEEMKR